MFEQLFIFCVSAPTVLPLNVDSFLSHKSLSVVLDHCIAASTEMFCNCISIIPFFVLADRFLNSLFFVG